MAAPRSAQPGTDAVRDQFRVRGSLAASKDTPGDVLRRDRVVPVFPRRRVLTLAGRGTRDPVAKWAAYRAACGDAGHRSVAVTAPIRRRVPPGGGSEQLCTVVTAASAIR